MTRPNFPMLSFLVTNYNNRKYIEECLSSLKRQTLKDWEIVLVDDCSTDGSADLIKKLADQDERIRYEILKSNVGGGGSKRRCAELAKGKYSCFVDSDDMLHEEAAQILVNELENDAKLALAYSQLYNCDEQMNVIGIHKISGEISKGMTNFTDPKNWISHLCVYRTADYLKTSGIDTRFIKAQDHDLYNKLEEVGNIKFVKQPLYYYRRHTTNASLGKNKLRARYFYCLVNEDTYRRRKANRFWDNKTYTQVLADWEKYFLEVGRSYGERREYLKMYQYVWRAFTKNPFSKLFRRKIRLALMPLLKN